MSKVNASPRIRLASEVPLAAKLKLLFIGEALMQRRFTLKALTAALALTTLSALPAYAADTIKVGILHSLSGTMAISETVLKDTVLMTIDEINAKGGVLGKTRARDC